jgi:hypothetical protein
MSQASLPSFEIGLNALSAILDKAEAFAAAKKIDPAVLLNTRLAPDMFPLTRQVQVATDLAKKGRPRSKNSKHGSLKRSRSSRRSTRSKSTRPPIVRSRSRLAQPTKVR